MGFFEGGPFQLRLSIPRINSSVKWWWCGRRVHGDKGPVPACPETNTKRSCIVYAVTSIALILGHLRAKRLGRSAQSLTPLAGSIFRPEFFGLKIRMKISNRIWDWVVQNDVILSNLVKKDSSWILMLEWTSVYFPKAPKNLRGYRDSWLLLQVGNKWFFSKVAKQTNKQTNKRPWGINMNPLHIRIGYTANREWGPHSWKIIRIFSPKNSGLSVCLFVCLVKYWSCERRYRESWYPPLEIVAHLSSKLR